MSLSLDGVRVLELARYQAGPRGGMIMSDEVVMTIVQPRPLFVRATADEKECQQITVGAACKVVPTASPDTKLAGKIEKVSAAPIAPVSDPPALDFHLN